MISILSVSSEGDAENTAFACLYYKAKEAIAISDKGNFLLSAEERRRKELADQDAQKAAEKRANDQKAVMDKKQSFRHDFHVAAFSVALTLFLEHIDDIVDFVKTVFKGIALLFH